MKDKFHCAYCHEEIEAPYVTSVSFPNNTWGKRQIYTFHLSCLYNHLADFYIVFIGEYNIGQEPFTE